MSACKVFMAHQNAMMSNFIVLRKMKSCMRVGRSDGGLGNGIKCIVTTIWFLRGPEMLIGMPLSQLEV